MNPASAFYGRFVHYRGEPAQVVGVDGSRLWLDLGRWTRKRCIKVAASKCSYLSTPPRALACGVA